MEQLAIKDRDQYEFQLTNAITNVDRYVNRNYLSNLSQNTVLPIDEDLKRTNSIRLFLINKIIFDDKENSNDKLISVYSALQNIGSMALLIIKGAENGVDYYAGINDTENVTTAERTFNKSFVANFPGSELKKCTNSEISQVLSGNNYENDCSVTSVTAVPSMRDEDKDKYVQGIEKFIDAMKGESYTAIFISKPVNQADMNNRKLGLEQLYSSLSPFAKSTLAYGENESLSVAEGVFDNFSKTINESVSTTLGKNKSTNESDTVGTNIGMNLGFSIGKNRGKTKGTSSGTSTSKSDTSGTAETTGSGTNKTDTTTTGTSQTLTLEKTNKTVDTILKNIDEQLERIKACEAFGIWETAAYFIADEIQVSIVAANTYKALIAGDKSSVESSYINIWNQFNENTHKVLDYIKYCQHPSILIHGFDGFEDQVVTPANYISGNELPLFMGLPHKSVNGVSVTNMAEFSRNVFVKNKISDDPNKKIQLGCIHHMGVDEFGNNVQLDLDNFTSHCFICGSTGSGKSNTVYHLINNFINKDIPFLVIEPAKGEYKKDFGKLENINVFGTNPYYGTMLKINPFQFDPKIHILEHLDRLIEIFNACWEMYAAMPAILKNAVEKAYVGKGWDLLNSVYTKGSNPEYPTFSDVLNILPKIINNSGYSADTQGDYTGALVTRVESLTNGITGQIFCDNYFIDDKTLFDENTIVDLSRVGSNETKSLIMGIMVMKLNEYRMANTVGTNKALSHITVLEEAHNLLKNVSQAQGQQSANPIGKSVEMICNSIAEMRTYGEGFIIVDQSPSSVDIAAIKNTNTKIIMRLPEKADCEAVGNAIGLKDNQVLELSKLPVGVAAVMQNNWLDAVLCKINRASNKYELDCIKQIDYSTMKAIRSSIVEEMLLQFSHKNRIDTDKVISLIRSFDAPDKIKEEFINRIINLGKSDDDNYQLCACYTLMNISNVKSVFEINEGDVVKENRDSGKMIIWKNNIIKLLKMSITINNDSLYESLFRRLLISLITKNVSGRPVYANAYDTIYYGGK